MITPAQLKEIKKIETEIFEKKEKVKTNLMLQSAGGKIG